MLKDDKFTQAIKLYDGLGDSVLDDGRTVRDACRLVGKISLWDCLSTYLILYRLPLCVSAAAGRVHSRREFVRPFLGTLARIRDTVFFPPRYTNQGLLEPNPKPGYIRILYLSFNETFFRDVLQSVYIATDKKNSVYQSLVLTNARDGHRSKTQLSIWDFYSEDVIESDTRGLSSLKELKRELLDAITPKRYLPPDGVCVDWQQLKREFRWLCNRELPRLIYFAAAAYKVLSHYAPTIIVTADDADQKCKLFELVARELRIPALVIQQGFTRSDYPDWRHFAGEYVAAMGPTSLETLVGQGVPREVVTVTGHPGFDKLKYISGEENTATRVILGIGSDDFLIVFCSQPYYLGTFRSPEVRSEMIRACCETVSAVPGARLIVKAHPQEDVSALKKLCANCPNIQIVDSQVEVASLIKACDVFITMFSQTTLEAIYADKPVININFPGSGVKSPFLDGKATCLVKSREEIRIAISKLLEGDYGFFKNQDNRIAKDKMLKDWAFLNDGKATDRVIDLISNICRSRLTK